MFKINTLKGVSPSVVIAVIAVLAVVGGVVYYNTRPEGEIMMNKGQDMMKEGEAMMEGGDAMMKEGEAMMEEGDKMMKGEDGAMMEGEAMMEEGAMMHNEYTGEVLAKSTSGALLLDFNLADYESAVANEKLVVLYFYANWCPVCKAEFPKMQEAFRKLDVDGVVGFRVNYNDNQTDSDEKALAKEFGVGYQHTKVLVKGGKRILKSPEGWEEDRYLTEIANAL